VSAPSAIDVGTPPELAWLPVAALRIDERYQRTLESRRSQLLIERIGREFRWLAFQAILATPVAGEAAWLVIDGQHRVEGARRAGIAHVPAVVVLDITLEQQAAAFVRANIDRVAVTRFALHHAALLAGDPVALAIANVCRLAGVAVPKYPKPADKMKAGETLALSTIAGIVKRSGERNATAILRAVADAYREIPGAITAAVLMGTAQIYSAAMFERRREVMAAVTDFLRRTPPEKLASKIRHRRELYGGTEWSNAAAIIKNGIGVADAVGRVSREGGAAVKPPTREQLMGGR
jgi:hypothetical protein